MKLDTEKALERILNFRNSRNWKQFHKIKDMIQALNIEVSELSEHFLWKEEKEIKEYSESNKTKVEDEVADVLYWILLIANDLNIDLDTAFNKKMDQNEAKYPIDKAYGKNTKYDKL